MRPVAKPTSARGAAFGDFDNDGDVDVLVNPINDVPQLLRNESSGRNHWLVVKLVGTSSNRSGIGAEVISTTGKTRQVRQILSGGSYLSQSDLRAHFGLGQAEKVDVLEIRWPSGITQRLTDVLADQILTVKEAASSESTSDAP